MSDVKRDHSRTHALLDEIGKLGYSAANDRCTSLCWALETELDAKCAELAEMQKDAEHWGATAYGMERTLKDLIPELQLIRDSEWREPIDLYSVIRVKETCANLLLRVRTALAAEQQTDQK